MMNSRWEDLGKSENSLYLKSDRMKVPGGWIVRSYAIMMQDDSKAASVTMIFISDESRAWVLG